MDRRPHVVALGGGTGTPTVLRGLKRHQVRLSAIVSSADNGGSSGKLRDEYGIMPPGDIGKCMGALAKNERMRDLFAYRFPGGGFSGHTLWNIIFTAQQKFEGGDLLAAVNALHEMLCVAGRVSPVSKIPAELCAELEDGEIVDGEHEIDAPNGERAPIVRCFLRQRIAANPEALELIADADAIIIGPGDLYTTLVPILLVDGIAEAVANARAKRILVMNLATKRGETDGYSASRFLRVIEEYIGERKLDHVVINAASPLEEVIERYRKAGEPPVEDDLNGDSRILRAPLLSDMLVEPVKGDPLRRSLLRHDPDKLADALMRCIA